MLAKADVCNQQAENDRKARSENHREGRLGGDLDATRQIGIRVHGVVLGYPDLGGVLHALLVHVS